MSTGNTRAAFDRMIAEAARKNTGPDFTARDIAQVRNSARPAVLNALKHRYQLAGLTPAILGKLSGLGIARIRALGNATNIEEPWFDEAVTLARVLNINRIAPLMTLSGNLTDCPMGVSIASDVDAYRAGVRIPLSIACRLAVRFGLDDPIELVATSRETQAWATIERNERLAAPGECPWCRALAPADGSRPDHLPTCLPNNLWGARDIGTAADLGHIPRPKGAGIRRAAAAVGWGIKPLRERVCKTQEQFAASIGVNNNHFAKIERGDANLTQDIAERIAAVFKVDMATLYVKPIERVQAEELKRDAQV